MPTGSVKRKPRKELKMVRPDEPDTVAKVVNTPLPDPDQIVFALDIGTRTVVGIVGYTEGTDFHVLDVEIAEHRNRAMLDGQIHDIGEVAIAVREVKDKLEARTGIVLKRAAIAAAGRVLKTSQVTIDRDVDPSVEIDHDMIASLEMEGIELAQNLIETQDGGDDAGRFYCVGYSTINYYLNGYIIGSLYGHRGKKISAEMIATFLPKLVVDSLYSVMKKSGLEVYSMTLEPIAAISVAIPKDLRMLNLALVDIGAGTSDIAITRDGSVTAFAMAPVAGDEITEKIAQYYLLDFATAETVKRALAGKRDTLRFADILGKKYQISRAEILDIVRPSVELLADTIAKGILDYNKKPVNAVFLIGGGSQIPELPSMIAEKLSLPKDRVVVRGREILRTIRYTGKLLSGPEGITPFGIAVSAKSRKGHDFIEITLNQQKISLFNAKKLSVADALSSTGIQAASLIGRSGKSLNFEFNGVQRTIKGEHGIMAEISINDKPCSIDTLLRHGDQIRFTPAVQGKDARLFVSDLVPELRDARIMLNGEQVRIGTRVFLNGRPATGDEQIACDDVIHTEEILSVTDLLKIYDIHPDTYAVMVNQVLVGENYLFRSGDDIRFVLHSELQPKNHQPSGVTPPAEQPVSAPATAREVPVHEAAGDRVFINGKAVRLSDDKKSHMFVDLFNYIQFDLSKPQGTLVLKLNGRNANFTDEIAAGDQIEISWQKL